jgi:hypothetical protein
MMKLRHYPAIARGLARAARYSPQALNVPVIIDPHLMGSDGFGINAGNSGDDQPNATFGQALIQVDKVVSDLAMRIGRIFESRRTHKAVLNFEVAYMPWREDFRVRSPSHMRSFGMLCTSRIDTYTQVPLQCRF